MNDNIDISPLDDDNQLIRCKKEWKKPVLFCGEDIGFFGLSSQFDEDGSGETI